MQPHCEYCKTVWALVEQGVREYVRSMTQIVLHALDSIRLHNLVFPKFHIKIHKPHLSSSHTLFYCSYFQMNDVHMSGRTGFYFILQFAY